MLFIFKGHFCVVLLASVGLVGVPERGGSVRDNSDSTFGGVAWWCCFGCCGVEVGGIPEEKFPKFVKLGKK